jgi:hypothetical protein
MNSFPFESVSGLTLLFVDEEHEVTIWAYTHRSDGGGMMRMFFDNEEIDVRSFSDDKIKTIDEWEEEAKNWQQSKLLEWQQVQDALLEDIHCD